MHWGHKASVVGYPRQWVPLDARATKDAATFDGKTLYPHVKELFEMYPEIQPSVERVLYDSASDSDEIKAKFKEEWGIELKASFNPRGKKEVTENLHRGIDKITPYSIPVCKAGCETDEPHTCYVKRIVGGRTNPVCLCLHTRLYYLSGLCRPYGAKTIGVSLYHRSRGGLRLLHPDGVSLYSQKLLVFEKYRANPQYSPV